VGRRRDRGEPRWSTPLVVALEMVGLDELRDRDAEAALAEWNELVEALSRAGGHRRCQPSSLKVRDDIGLVAVHSRNV